MKTQVDVIGKRLTGLVEHLISQRERENVFSDVQCQLESFKAQIMPALGNLSRSFGNIERLHHPKDATSTSQAGKSLCIVHIRFFKILDAGIRLTACSLLQCLLPLLGK